MVFDFLNFYILAHTEGSWNDQDNEDFIRTICEQRQVPEEFKGICDVRELPPDSEITAAYKSPLRTQNDITYFFYSQRHPSRSIKIRYTTIDLLRFTDFNAKKHTLFIVHGWNNCNESEVNYKIKESILAHDDINVFVVDWSPMAGKNYISARGSVVRVGQYLAGFIMELKEKYGLKLSTVKFVGYSLGAHVCGNAGKI